MDSLEWKTIERMTESFTTFARTGDPNNESIGDQWQPISVENNKYKCLNIGKVKKNFQVGIRNDFGSHSYHDNIYNEMLGFI